MNSRTAKRLKALTERRLTGEELRERLDTPIGEDERAAIRALIRWFRRRYPRPADRLAYVRRAYARWTASTRR
jgi:hypothetical protein